MKLWRIAGDRAPTHVAAAIAVAFSALASGCATTSAKYEGVAAYDHVFVIMEENKDYAEIVNPAFAPNLAKLAAAYGDAAGFYGEVHPSEANYLALLGGDTFGISDDDAYYCRAASTRPFCEHAAMADYPDHTIHARHLGDQLVAAGLSWKSYNESLPAPGSLAVISSDPQFDDGTRGTALYASKHTGFVNFADVQDDPRRADRIVGFDQLDRDLAAGAMPNFALIVPNQCNEMHGLHGRGVPKDCDIANKAALIARGDAFTGALVERIMATPMWSSPGNAAIVITFDEGDGKTREGCCSLTPQGPSNFGGGHIPTIVITNHGPRAVRDDTPYNHYSLLRTLEDAFRLRGRLNRAGDTAGGVKPMTALFAAP